MTGVGEELGRIAELDIDESDRRVARDLIRRELLHRQISEDHGRRAVQGVAIARLIPVNSLAIESIRWDAELAASHYHGAERLILTRELVQGGGRAVPYSVEVDDQIGGVRLIDLSLDSVIDDGDAVEVLRRVIRYLVNPLTERFRSEHEPEEEPDVETP